MAAGTNILIGAAAVAGVFFLRKRARRSAIVEAATVSPFTPGGELTVFARGTGGSFTVELIDGTIVSAQELAASGIFDLTIVVTVGADVDQAGFFADTVQEGGVSVTVT